MIAVVIYLFYIVPISAWCWVPFFVRRSLKRYCFYIQWTDNSFFWQMSLRADILKQRHLSSTDFVVFNVSYNKFLSVKALIWILFLSFESINSFVRNARKKAVSQSSDRANVLINTVDLVTCFSLVE